MLKYYINCGWGGTFTATLVKVIDEVDVPILVQGGFTTSAEATEFAENKIKEIISQEGV